MAQKAIIPIHTFGGNTVTIERFAFRDFPALDDSNQPERHVRHSFFLIEQGIFVLEIDFKRFEIIAPSLVYMHPDQVHRIWSSNEVQAVAWGVIDEQLTATYHSQLESAPPVALDEKNFSLMQQLAENNQDRL